MRRLHAPRREVDVPAPTTVFINGRFLEQPVTGVQRFALEVLSALDELLPDELASRSVSVAVVAPPRARDLSLRNISLRRVGPLDGHAWEQSTLPAATLGSRLIGFGPTGPALKGDQVVTIHDAAVRAVPESYARRFRAWYGLLLPTIVRRSRFVMTVSDFSRGELVRHFGARPEQIRVTGEGWQHMHRIAPDDRILEQHSLRPRGYLLCTSSVAPHKNFGVVARALRRLPSEARIQVVVAGAVDRRVFGDTAIPGTDSVRWLGRVTDGELRALYANAAAFVFPSLYEGFGLPPLEAMAEDCPVLCSNAASLPEVCADAALYFEPTDELALCDLIQRVISDELERHRLIRRGRERLSRYSWRRAALAYLSLIRDWTESGCDSSDASAPILAAMPLIAASGVSRMRAVARLAS
jgi:glycosyltransferase involved in cell wall biosynthesis